MRRVEGLAARTVRVQLAPSSCREGKPRATRNFPDLSSTTFSQDHLARNMDPPRQSPPTRRAFLVNNSSNYQLQEQCQRSRSGSGINVVRILEEARRIHAANVPDHAESLVNATKKEIFGTYGFPFPGSFFDEEEDTIASDEAVQDEAENSYDEYASECVAGAPIRWEEILKQVENLQFETKPLPIRATTSLVSKKIDTSRADCTDCTDAVASSVRLPLLPQLPVRPVPDLGDEDRNSSLKQPPRQEDVDARVRHSMESQAPAAVKQRPMLVMKDAKNGLQKRQPLLSQVRNRNDWSWVLVTDSSGLSPDNAAGAHLQEEPAESTLTIAPRIIGSDSPIAHAGVFVRPIESKVASREALRNELAPVSSEEHIVQIQNKAFPHVTQHLEETPEQAHDGVQATDTDLDAGQNEPGTPAANANEPAPRKFVLKGTNKKTKKVPSPSQIRDRSNTCWVPVKDSDLAPDCY